MTTIVEQTSEVTRLAKFKPNLDSLPTLAAVVIIVGMLAYGELAYGGILQFSTLSNLLINNAYLIVLAIGLTFVILTGGIDLSVGAVIAVSSLIGVMLSSAGLPAILVIVLMIGVGSLFGLASGILIHYFRVQPFIATLAMMFLARGLASMLSTEPQRLADDSPIRGLSTEIKIIDGPKINDLVVTPAVFFLLGRKPAENALRLDAPATR